MRICVDLDGVICELRRADQPYSDLKPVVGAVEKIRALRRSGHEIIIYTARHMRTCSGNVGLVMARQGQVTLRWLEQHQVEFDEIHFGKPHADVYIDDNAVRFADWGLISGDGTDLPVSNEKSQVSE